jgi:hypothetical protein
MEMILEQTTKAVARKQVDAEHLEKRICFLEEEEKRRKRIVTLPPSSYYVENSAPNALPYYYSASRQSSSLPNWPSESYDPWSEYRNRKEKEREKEEIHEL